MKDARLDPHDVIGWDIDGTLFSGPNAEYFCAYIRAHPEKTHHVITFRDEKWAQEVFADLRPFGIRRNHISSVSACPQHLWRAYHIPQIESPPHHVWEYLHWKGKRAKELGCTVLIDDVPDEVHHGCTVHGIEFLHALMDFSSET